MLIILTTILGFTFQSFAYQVNIYDHKKDKTKVLIEVIDDCEKVYEKEFKREDLKSGKAVIWLKKVTLDNPNFCH